MSLNAATPITSLSRSQDLPEEDLPEACVKPLSPKSRSFVETASHFGQFEAHPATAVIFVGSLLTLEFGVPSPN